MAEEYITKELHDKDVERIEDEQNRQNYRIDKLEDAVKQINDLVAAVKVMASNLEAMNRELGRQGDRLDKIEERPTKRWDAVVSGIIAGVVGILIGLLSSGVLH
jgi:DNA repair ATPase RecN